MNLHIKAAEIARVSEMLAPMCDGDEQLFADMLEAETDLHSVALRIHEIIARDTETLIGIKDRKASINEREARIKARVATGKEAIGKLLRAAQIKKLELPEITYSVRDGKPGLDILDPEAVPDEFCTFKKVPSKTEINAAFDPDGDLPNWLSRTEPHDVVTGRTR